MPNRGGATYGRESRRVRLWLRPETWALIDRKASERMWNDGYNAVIEEALELWRVSQLDWANRRAIAEKVGQLAAILEAKV